MCLSVQVIISRQPTNGLGSIEYVEDFYLFIYLCEHIYSYSVEIIFRLLIKWGGKGKINKCVNIILLLKILSYGSVICMNIILLVKRYVRHWLQSLFLTWNPGIFMERVYTRVFSLFYLYVSLTYLENTQNPCTCLHRWQGYQ